MWCADIANDSRDHAAYSLHHRAVPLGFAVVWTLMYVNPCTNRLYWSGVRGVEGCQLLKLPVGRVNNTPPFAPTLPLWMCAAAWPTMPKSVKDTAICQWCPKKKGGRSRKEER